MSVVALLQISDLHFGVSNNYAKQARQLLLNDVIKRVAEQDGLFSYLILSGDIIHGACSNHRAAYKDASKYIKRLQKELKIPPKRTIVVPGNHDVDNRSKNRNDAIEWLKKNYSTRDGEIQPDKFRELNPTDEFCEFYKEVTGQVYINGHHIIKSKDNIDFLCINSTLISIKSTADYGHLILGMQHLDAALQEHSQGRCIVAVSHHPPSWLADYEKAEIFSRLSGTSRVLLCCGHVHSASAATEQTVEMNGSHLVKSITPSLMDGSDLTRPDISMGYNTILVQTTAQDFSISSYRYSTNGYSQAWTLSAEPPIKMHQKNSLSNYVDPRINPCILFYHRTKQHISLEVFAHSIGKSVSSFSDLEKLDSNYTTDSIMMYPKSDCNTINKIAVILGIDPRELIVDPSRNDPTRRMSFYRKHKGLNKMPCDRKKTKVVVFDFDGTLTINGFLRTSWERMWEICGYTKHDCMNLHKRYSNGSINHPTWCNLTAEKFKIRGFSEHHLDELANGSTLINDCRVTLNELHDKGIRLYIVSGSVTELIKRVLGAETANLFTDIQANQMTFDECGNLERIIGTEFDFDGKATYVRKIIESGFSPDSIVFFGNSFNDISVCKTGVKSVCINPKGVDPFNAEHWTCCKSDVTSMKEFLEFIDE